MWENQYKSSAQPTTKSNPQPKPQTGVLAGVSGASEVRTGNAATDPLTMWLSGGLNLDDKGQPVNPLKWWMNQGCAGNTHGGLLQMALDVLRCPATTVDVERSFNFGRDYASVRRHRLSASSLTRGMTVAFYSKNGMIPSGVLQRWKIDQRKNKKSSKGKQPEIICEVDSTQSGTRVPAFLGAGAGAGIQFGSDFRVVPAPATGTQVPGAIPNW
ncbi:hypothetical protein PSTG_09960 [Puccinia striiformis f. sp. tritici PST-78]|uniref:HAT C-terminal dimerisation domain-containing protein n=1 Tax=Puccinia striiformis f. sp. tritici PST-78 TaxID=1165861 RepID=A0A0L0VC17_9BASI|nr:hypothetical protein PSTG_09960 [Puccinia striiformis f. sp. tritici PST-78]